MFGGLFYVIDVVHMQNILGSVFENSQINIPKGVFSKIYRFPNGAKRSVACYTPRRAWSTFDGDLAEIWQTIFEDKGALYRAYNYILNRGSFEATEALSVLYGFIIQLEESCLVSLNNSPKKELKQMELPYDAIIGFVLENHILFHLCVELTYRCNEKCEHCYCPPANPKDEISLSTFSSLMDEFEAIGGFRLSLTGGEVLVRDDIEDILKDIVGRNIIVDIISNLSALDDDTLKLISEIKPLEVGVTVHSAIPEVHDSITNVKGSFDKTINSIVKLRKKGIRVKIRCLLFDKTAKGYEGVKKLAATLGCEFQFDLKVTPKLGCSSYDQNIRITDEELILGIFRNNNTKFTTDKQRDYVCGAGQAGLTISPCCEARPCISLMRNVGKYPDNSLAQIWNGKPLKKVVSELKVKNFSKCLKCPDLEICDLCVGNWQSKDTPDDYTCFLTKLRRKVQ